MDLVFLFVVSVLFIFLNAGNDVVLFILGVIIEAFLCCKCLFGISVSLN